MEMCKELQNLANKCKAKGHKLYIVGGFVRDNILGYPSHDIDICSNISYEDMTTICKELKYKTVSVNKTLGTIHISTPAGVFEYTRFRKESYSSHGEHTPSNISFVDDINEDVMRRDLTINSIYYDISEDKMIDLTSGITDIHNGIIRTVNNPEITLNDDGLRILRTIRFASTFNFKFDSKTYKALNMYSARLSKISKERILDEVKELVVSDLKHGIPNYIFLKCFQKLNLGKYIFNSSLSRIHKFSSKDIRAFYSLSKDCRLIGFYILILKNYLISFSKDNQLEYYINILLGLDGIKESNVNQRITHKLYKIIQNLNTNNDTLTASINYLTCSDAEREIVDKFTSKKGNKELSDNIHAIKINNIPLSANELDISPQDIIDCGIDEKYISKILSTLYNQVLSMKIKNKNSDLKELAINIHQTLKDIK